jgi:hypothetical protein
MSRTHTGRVPGGHPAVSLPPDAIAEGVRRLGWIALVYAIAYVAGPFTRLILTGVAGTIDSYEFVIPDVFGVAAVIMALTVFAMASIWAWCSRWVGRWVSPSASSGTECR